MLKAQRNQAGVDVTKADDHGNTAWEGGSVEPCLPAGDVNLQNGKADVNSLQFLALCCEDLRK